MTGEYLNECHGAAVWNFRRNVSCNGEIWGILTPEMRDLRVANETFIGIIAAFVFSVDTV